LAEPTGRRTRPALIAAALLALVATGWSGAAASPARADGAPAAPRAVIIVGPTETQTNGYIDDAQAVAADAASHGMEVVKLYSSSSYNTHARPGTGGVLAATWQNVVKYVNGADGGPKATIVAYMGHGNGWPNPYPPGYMMPDRVDGFVLDYSAGTPCARGGTSNYCGEGPIGASLRPNPNAVVLLNHLCYASGDSEPQNGTPTVGVAEQRADNYGAGFLKAGAAAVFAYGISDVRPVIDAIFTTHQSLDDVFMSTGYYGTADIRFGSSRVLDSDVHMDPHAKTAGADPYYRSVVGRLAVTTDQVLGGLAPAPDPDRWAGSDRYGTAQAIDDKSFPNGPTPVVFVASGAAFPDALAGAAAAARQHAPLVITSPDGLPASSKAELDRLKPQQIVILGGPAGVSAAVEQQLDAIVADPANDVRRIAGSDRYATAGAIATTFFTGPVPVLYIADGLNFPDALAGAAAAGHFGAPILLVAPTAVPDATLQAIKTLAPKAIKVLGGTASVSDAVMATVGAAAKVTPTRLAGADRYATAVAISQDTYPGNPSVGTLYVASGANFPDALVGAALGQPLVLAQGRTVASSVLAEVTRLDPGRIVFLGGPGSISYTVVLAIRGAAPSAT
jgi:putative cell wall-binding protein